MPFGSGRGEMVSTEGRNLPLDHGCAEVGGGAALWAASRPLKVPCGDAAISKMQIAHFLDFVSVDVDEGGQPGHTACTI